MAQSYIYQAGGGRANMPFERMIIGDTRRMLHRSRYLHWKTSSATSASLRLNGNVVDTASGADSGVVDLNSLGLATNGVYTLEWTGTAVVCTRLYESPESSGLLALPSSNPSFGGGANAEQLNALSTNTQYLLDYGIKTTNLGFVTKVYGGLKPTKEIHYYATHQNRYLYWRANMIHGGDAGVNQLTLELYLNGTKLWEKAMGGDDPDGGRQIYAEAWIDLQGTDHTEGGATQSGSGSAGDVTIANGSSLGLSLGEEYEVYWRAEADFGNCQVIIYQIGEYLAKSIW